MASEKILNQKKEEVAKLAAKIKEAKVVLLTDYRGINVSDVTGLRAKLRNAEVEYSVIKNNITRRALAECNIEGLDDALLGPTAVVIGNNDYLDACKTIYEYAKDTASDGNDVSIGSYGSKGIESLTADSFLNTDSTQMQRYLASFRGDQDAQTISADEKQRLSEIAHSIANNTNVHSKIRKDDYGEALKTFAPDVDWDDVFNGNSIKVAHSPAPTPAPSPSPTTTTAPSTPSTLPSQTQAARGAGANAATQSATATAEAARNAQRINRAADNAGQRINSADRTRVDQALKNAENGRGRETDSGIWLPS